MEINRFNNARSLLVVSWKIAPHAATSFFWNAIILWNGNWEVVTIQNHGEQNITRGHSKCSTTTLTSHHPSFSFTISGQIIFMTYHYENLKNECDNERERFLERLNWEWNTGDGPLSMCCDHWRTGPRDLRVGLRDLELDKNPLITLLWWWL